MTPQQILALLLEIADLKAAVMQARAERDRFAAELAEFTAVRAGDDPEGSGRAAG